MPAVEGRAMELYGRGTNLFIISILFAFTAFILVVSRLMSRVTTARKLGPDDYAIMLSMVFSIGLTICNCISVDHGSGKAMKTLQPEDIRMALQAFWVAQMMYKFTINLTKTSICLLYLRIFAHVGWFRKTVYVVMAYVLLYATASIVATIFECTPVARVWDRTIEGTCINLTEFWYANAAANIIGDFAILLLPMPVVRSLQLPNRQKWGLTMVFGLGAFVCITSILRMTTLNASSKTKDQTHGSLNSTIWTTIEANTGIICACLPMLKAPLTALFPKLFPRGSYQCDYSDSLNTPHRQGGRSTDRNSPAAAYDGWGRLVETKPIAHHGILAKTPSGWEGKASTSTETESAYGMDGKDIPLGSIAKTTHVKVQYAQDRRLPLHPNDNSHTRSLSNLVGGQYGHPYESTA